MNPHQRLFLIQAKADMVVFERFWKDSTLPACHALHYLQMATELLGKAHAWKNGPKTDTHREFVGFSAKSGDQSSSAKATGVCGQE